MPRSPILSHDCGIASPGQPYAKFHAASPLLPIPAWRNAAQGAPVCLCGTLSKVAQARSSDTAAVQTLVQLTGTLISHPVSVHSQAEKHNSKLVSYHTGSRNYQLWNLSSALKRCSAPSSFLCFSGFYFLLLPVPFPFHITSQPANFPGEPSLTRWCLVPAQRWRSAGGQAGSSAALAQLLNVCPPQRGAGHTPQTCIICHDRGHLLHPARLTPQKPRAGFRKREVWKCCTVRHMWTLAKYMPPSKTQKQKLL